MHVSNCSWWRWVMFLFPLPLVAICKMLSPTMTKWSLSTSSLLVWISSCTFAFKNRIKSFSWDPNWCFKGICRWHLLLLRLVITVQGKKKDYLQSFSWWIYEMLIYWREILTCILPSQNLFCYIFSSLSISLIAWATSLFLSSEKRKC